MSVNFVRDRMYGSRARIGYTSPPMTTEVFPYEFYRLAPPGVTLVITTLALAVRTPEELSQSYNLSIKAAREMAASKVDVIILGGVPIAMSRGHANAEALLQSLEAELGVPVASSASAIAKAIKVLGCKKAVVVHSRSSDRVVTTADTKRDYEVLGSVGLDIEFRQLGHVSRDRAYDLGRQILKKYPEADTIMFGSPHWPVMEAIESLEREFGITVLSSIQAILWEGMRRAGVDDRLPNCGRLLRDF
jgi:maleate isomerase